ncbi:MAG TPA: SUMF1/EgtB/PvdO family nonheme iron enzyme, partial [Polyangiaceae bacterium]
MSCADLLGVDDLRFDLEEEDTIVGPGCVARGPNVVNIDGKFCIDSTEVTYAEYATFLASNPAPQTDDACSWNTFVPSTGWPGTNPQLPVAHVDFCDARGYCAWAGKRLCGEIGGGSFAFGAFPGNRLKTELYYACSHAGELNFPYGNSYDPSWPGNVRELKNAIDAYAVLGSLPDPRTTRDAEFEHALRRAIDPLRPYAEQKREHLRRFQRLYLEALLSHTNGNQSQAARISGLDRSHLSK